MAADITNTIIDYLIANLGNYVNEDVDPDDDFILTDVSRPPLQDDPTQRAFYITVGPDFERSKEGRSWRMPIDAAKDLDGRKPVHEIGPDLIYVNYFLLESWLPEQDSRENFYLVGGLIQRRVERAMLRINQHVFTDGGLTTDDGLERTAAIYPGLFCADGSDFRYTGGDNQWYPRIAYRFHVFTRIDGDFWRST